MKNEVKSVSPLTSIDEIESENGTHHEVVKNKKRRRSSFKKKGAITKKLLIKFLDSAGFQAYMFVCLVLALFAVDVIALHSYGNDVTEAMNIILTLVFASFLAEMVLNFFIREDYSKLETVMNFIATFSILLDITWITELWEKSDGGGGSYERASRAARVGARAGRIGRIVRVVRLVRVIKMFALFFRCFRKDEEEDSMAPTNLGQKLAESISRLVALLIMITIWVAPMLTFEEFDESLSAWITVFDSHAQNNATTFQLEPVVTDYYDFIMDGGLLRPVELNIHGDYWDWTEISGGYTPRKKDKITLQDNSGLIVLKLDSSKKNQEDAMLNILLVVVVVVELICFIALLNQTTSLLVVRPLERIFTIIRINASQIVGALDIEDSDEESEDEKEVDEINTIEAAVQKMTRIVKHVSGGGAQGSQIVQNYIDDANIDEKTKAWLVNQYDGSETVAETPAKKKKKERKFKRSIIAYDNVDLDFLNSWNFDVFLLKEEEMFSYVRAMFMELGLYEAGMVTDEILSNFLKEVRKNYHDNPYHNFHHVIDVTHGVYRILRLTEDRLDLTEYERMSLMVAAICHDMDHPGVNNAYLVHTLDPLAIKYNDSGVLENTHVACLYSMVTTKPNSNIFVNIKDDKVWRDMRKNIIGCILHTDMAHHFKMVSQMDVFFELHANVIEKKDNPFTTPDDRQFLMNMVLHSADISNAVKPFGIYTKWANCVLEEFFSQGDKEAAKGLPKSPMMDRETTSRAMSQVNFIEFIVGPLYLNLVKILPELSELAITLLNNRKTWGDMYIEEVDGKSMSSMDFNAREEEKAKCTNRYLKFKEKFEPVMEKMEELGFASEQLLKRAGIQKKERPNPRASVIGNLARRASISMGK
ncbi:3',5'-cyclic-nucleotide phosphodiesterase [Chloropicon primus]|uniref:Phosphodiesterase n=1 Tax=Chloropicon primus TaxID=1764295 RepID=A0A5B8MUT9_9CHLO|nr:3',5'-cyclic-nucleotide phosphodiesterase [Chloropicon primus]UPR03776.1 3',5'-cyclic-nucleotide phosphodiesterase [Chloropicon primus]|eukprot:QDZ24568.1 3',5'-cyclic-nucleotide phosphodiesterase [Chloropicon primus]